MTQSGGICRISTKKIFEDLEVRIEFDRKKNSASNEPICVEYNLSFDRLSRQKLSVTAP